MFLPAVSAAAEDFAAAVAPASVVRASVGTQEARRSGAHP